MRSKITIGLVLLSFFSMLLVTSNVYAEDVPDNKIRLHANGGKFSDNSEEWLTGECDNENLRCSLTPTDGSLIPTRGGYDFAGWSKSANGSVCIDPGQGIYFPNYTDLYACWIDQSKTKRGLNPDPITVTEEGCYSCEDFAYLFAGDLTTKYKFFRAGDKLTSDCSSTTKNSDYIQTFPYIYCTPKNNTIYIYPNGGKGEDRISRLCSGDNKCTMKNALNDAINKFTKEGYTLTGFSTKEDQSDYINPYSSIDYSAYDKLYAYWTKNEDVKKATTEGCYYCENLRHTFNGSTDTLTVNHIYLSIDQVVPAGCDKTPVNGYRQWNTNYCIDKKRVIEKDANGGKFTKNGNVTTIMQDGCYASNNKCKLAAPGNTLPTREGYLLYGWSISDNMTNCISQDVLIDYSLYDKLYACWQREVVGVPEPSTTTTITTSTTTKEAIVTHPAITLPSNSQNNNNNSNNNSNTNTTIESPKTGVEDYILLSFLLVVLLGVSLVLINNKKQIFKKI